MSKITPNPPEADPNSPYLDGHLSKTLASADGMVNELAFDMEGSNRHVLLGVRQLIELSSLLADRVLDNVDPR